MQSSNKNSISNGPVWLLTAGSVLFLASVLFLVDLSPKVESEFFFSDEDPQLRAAQLMMERFPAPEQIVVRVASSDIRSDEYVSKMRDLTAELDTVTGVSGVTSIVNEDERRSPVWNRLLTTPDDSATNMIVGAYNPDPETLVAGLEAVWDKYDSPEFTVDVSGVVYVSELIRRSLMRDLMIFSTAAFLIFGTLVSLVYRNWRIVLGTVVTCVSACAVTLTITNVLNIKIGLLTANIAVIVFVLTLSHIVFMTSNWRRIREESEEDSAEPVGAAVRLTLQASFWCMLTTLLGFLSLLVASARPLRELGISGAIGTLTAIVVTYLVYPVYLKSIPRKKGESVRSFFGNVGSFLPARNRLVWLLGIFAVVILAATGLRQFNTDPSLVSYFGPGSDIREGLEKIDRDGGSSTLNIAVRDPDGNNMDSEEFNRKLWALQETLEADSSVGMAISPPLLIEHVRLQPFMSRANLNTLLNILEQPAFTSITQSFIRPERDEATSCRGSLEN